MKNEIKNTTKATALPIMNKSRIDITIVPSVIEPPPNGDKGISAMGPAIIATTARIMMALSLIHI